MPIYDKFKGRAKVLSGTLSDLFDHGKGRGKNEHSAVFPLLSLLCAQGAVEYSSGPFSEERLSMALNPQQNYGFCGRCGTANPFTQLHCSKCGARLPWTPSVPVAEPVQATRSTVKKWPLWATDERKIQLALANLEGFTASKWFLSSDGTTGFALDESADKVCLIEAEKEVVHRQVYGYRDILGAEVIEDGVILATTSGPAGGTARGATATRRSERVQSVAVKIVINNRTTLIHLVKFLHKEQQRGSSSHQAARARAFDCYNLLVAIVNLIKLMNHD
jgi:ribosomal protein L40E